MNYFLVTVTSNI